MIVNDDLRNWIGHEFKPVVHEIERGAVKKVAQATEDPCALHLEDEFDKGSKCDNIIIAPSIFLASLRVDEDEEWLKKLNIPQKKVVFAGVELEFFKPILTGDTILVTSKIADISEFDGRSGKMLEVVFERTYTNQKGESVARVKIRGLRY